MIRFAIPASGHVHLRIAWSPLWECVSSVRVLEAPARYAPLRPWIRRLSGAAVGDVSLLASLVRADGGYIPDFLAPPPVGPDLTFDDELTRLRSTAAEVVAEEMSRTMAGVSGTARRAGGGAPDPVARFAGDARGLRDALADALERYWKAAVAPEWPRLQALLEGEVLSRGRALALHGAGAVLGVLHPAITHRPGRVEVASPQDGDVPESSLELLLVPSIFSWPDVFTVHAPAWRASIYYPAVGIGTLWDQASATPEISDDTDPLRLLAGAGRARVLRALTRPATTGELAVLLGAAPAGVSSHLQRLRRAGLLERTRIGRRVFYQRSAAGQALLECFHAEGSKDS
jgi:DNA-binding transcriptional ArsR family regulator